MQKQEHVNEPQRAQEIKRFSRRSAVKVIAGLFAFIPAMKSLINAPTAFAYIPCDPESEVSCSWQSACSDPYRRGYNTWWKYEYCIDKRNGQRCQMYESKPYDTGKRC